MTNQINKQQIMDSIRALQGSIYANNVKAGWWRDAEILKQMGASGEFDDAFLARMEVTFIASKLALIHSEVSEALEGLRKDLNDDKLPHLPMFDVELADTIIRIFDTAGHLGIDLASAIFQKLDFNATREDHKIENRDAANGKKI